MDNKKWFKRKYPDSHEKILKFLCEYDLSNFRKYRYKIGILSKPMDMGGNTYNTGTLVLFKRTNPVNDYNYPMHYGLIRNTDQEYGYQSFGLFESMFIEIKK